MTYLLHPDAERDITDAMDFYGKQAGIAVATRFLDEFEHVAKLLAKNPGLGTLTAKGLRVFPMQVFPYLIVYRSLKGYIRILIVRHQHRKPNYGAGRQ